MNEADRSHYILLIRKTRSREALTFYHAEALRDGWSVRQLDRQIASLFYERTALSKKKEAMLSRGVEARPGDRLSADEEVRDPFVRPSASTSTPRSASAWRRI